MDEILSVIKNRRSTRQFEAKSLNQKVLMTILEAARMAPSGINDRSNKLYVLQNERTMARLQNALVGAVKRGNAEGIPADSKLANNPNYHFCYHAPVFVISTNRRANFNAFVDTGCLLENAMLQATAMGIGSCWINMVRRAQNDPEVHALLCEFGMSDDEIVTGGLALGYPANETPRHPKADGNEIILVEA